MEVSDSPDVGPKSFHLPAHLPPPGVKSNFIDPVTRAPDLVATSVLCLSVMVVCVAIRFYTKLHIKHKWGWDDCRGTYRPLIWYMLMLSRDLYTCRCKTGSKLQNLSDLIHRRSVLLDLLVLRYQVRMYHVLLYSGKLMPI